MAGADNRQQYRGKEGRPDARDACAVFERDFGPGTTQAAAATKAFNPEAGWTAVKK